MQQIRKRKWTWIGHTLRKGSTNITYQGLKWTPQGKRNWERPRICSTCRKHFPVLSSFMTNHQVCNMTGTTSGAGTAYPSGEPDFIPVFQWGSCYSIFSFMCMLCRSLIVLLYLFFWPLCCLFFFSLRILITPLVSLNSS